jgi:Flp pilus assembly protein TadG
MGKIWKRRVWCWLGRYRRDLRGNIAALTAMAIIPLVGIMGLATETGGWFLVQRAEQNAADSAVLATGQNYLFGGTTYISEGQAAAAKFGFVTGSNSTTVTPLINQTCPSPIAGSNCFKVTITKSIALNFSKILGYTGTGGSGTQSITASAMAKSKDFPISDCITSLGPGSDSYRVNGGPKLNLNGCTIQVNGDATCNGSNSSGNALYFFVSGTNKNNNCTPANNSVPLVADPYLTTYPASNIPANPCGNSPLNYWQASGSYGNGLGHYTPPSQPAANKWNGSVAAGGTPICGDVTLSGDTTITGSGTIVIENGWLNLNGHTLTGTGVTLIFTGPTVGNNFSPSHSPPTDGTLDISAPTSGTWSGVALYQDPNLTSGVDWTAGGSGLQLEITGLIYMPNSNIDFHGAVSKATGGLDCFTLVDWKIVMSGAVTVNEQQTQCAAAGLTPPSSNIRRPVLVQ